MKLWIMCGWILFIGCVCVTKADDNLLIQNLLESCYSLPYDPKTEMTDIVLLDAYYHDQAAARKIANEVYLKYTRNTNSAVWQDILSDTFTSESKNKEANIQFFRERVINDYYRLDSAKQLDTFSPYEWNGGQFTNVHPFLKNSICTPPKGTNQLWTLYVVQSRNTDVSIRAGTNSPIQKECFYINMYGLPTLIRMNLIIATARLDSAQDSNTNRHSSEPDWFRQFKLDEKRIKELLGGKTRFGHWEVTHPKVGVGQLSLIGGDGIDHNAVRILYNDLNPQKYYLAYVRHPTTGDIMALCAWDYDSNGTTTRFLRVEQTASGTLEAWAQYIIHFEKTTNIDWSLFNVDISKMSSIYDQRGKYPIQTLNGKVIFDASKNNYAPLPDGVINIKSRWSERITVFRVIIMALFMLPPLIMLFMAIKKRISK